MSDVYRLRLNPARASKVFSGSGQALAYYQQDMDRAVAQFEEALGLDRAALDAELRGLAEKLEGLDLSLNPSPGKRGILRGADEQSKVLRGIPLSAVTHCTISNPPSPPRRRSRGMRSPTAPGSSLIPLPNPQTPADSSPAVLSSPTASIHALRKLSFSNCES